MKNLKLLAIITTLLLVTSIFAVLPAFSGQPPITASTMYVGTIGQPKNVDPSEAYDTASGEIINNVYDSMLEFGSQGTNVTNKPTFTIPANGSVNVGTNVAVLGASTDIPGLCYMPVVTNYPSGATLWTFQVNTNLVFQNWVLPPSLGGGTISGQNLTAADIVYYFQRMLVQDSHNSPEWMFFAPAFGLGSFDKYQKPGTGPTLGSNETLVASLIQNFVNATGPSTVQFYFKYPAPGMYDIWAQTWSSVPPMQFSIDHGCWNGTFYPGWSADWRRFPNDEFTPLDIHTSRSLYTASGEPAMCGTGPYKFTYWNQATNEWKIDAFAGCVSHPWPGPYGAGSPAPTTVIETGINTWPTRKMEFLAGDSDMSVVNRANMYDLLASPSNAYLPISGLHLFYNIPTLVLDALFYQFSISAGSKWIPTVNGSPNTTFFQDIHVRWAFSNALNYSAYISGAWYGEAIHPNSWWAVGLTPLDAYLSPASLPAWDVNLDWAYGNLTAAGITSFSLTLLYNIGNDQRRIAAQEIADAFNVINTLHGSHYNVAVVGEDWPVYLADYQGGNLPLFIVGWQADFSDADDFVVPFYGTGGAFTYPQNYSNSTVDALITTEETYAAATFNATAGSPWQLRNDAFRTLQYDYWQQAPSVPTVQPTARHWERDWVNGYYFNQLYPGFYFQDLYKKTATVLTPVDVDVTKTITVLPTTVGTSTWTTLTQVYIWKGKMNQLYGGGLPGKMTFQIHVQRNDVVLAVPIAVAIAIQRYNLSNIDDCIPNAVITTLEYPNSTLVFVAPSPDPGASVTLQWYEDGVSITLPANSTWQPGGRGAIAPGAPASQSNLTDGTVNAGFNVTAYTTTNSTTGAYFVLVGDVNGDATVDILDAIKLANSFLLVKGQTGFNADADINYVPSTGQRGDGVINILDAITLANNFGQKIIYTTLGP